MHCRGLCKTVWTLFLLQCLPHRRTFQIHLKVVKKHSTRTVPSMFYVGSHEFIITVGRTLHTYFFVQEYTCQIHNVLKLVRNLVAHGDAREGKWRGNWRKEWVASTLTPPPNVVYPALVKLMGTSRLPAVDWTDAPHRFKWTRPFGGKTKSGFCACAITFRMSYTWSGVEASPLCV